MVYFDHNLWGYSFHCAFKFNNNNIYLLELGCYPVAVDQNENLVKNETPTSPRYFIFPKKSKIYFTKTTDQRKNKNEKY